MKEVYYCLLDNNLSCCTIRHLDDVDALLQGVDLHTIDSVDFETTIH